MTTTVAIAFTPAPATNHPNLKARTSAAALRTFEGLIEVCFASVRRWNPDVQLRLVTSAQPGLEFARRLDRVGAGVLVTPFDHEPPPGFFPYINASLFTVDAMAALADEAGDNDRILLIDPDVVCSGSLEPVIKAIPDDGVLAYEVNDPPGQPNQSLNGFEAGRLHTMIDGALTGVPRHFGGECYGFTSASWKRLAPHTQDAWQFSLSRWRAGTSKFVTEEHILDFALRYVTVQEANPYIRRIWTAPTHRNVTPSDLVLSLWHLPAEKHRGLSHLARLCRDPQSWFWVAGNMQWRKQAARACGLTRRPPGRWLWDTSGRAVRTVQSLRARTRDGGEQMNLARIRQNVIVDGRPLLTVVRAARWLVHCARGRAALIEIWPGGPQMQLDPHLMAHGSTSLYMKRLDYEPHLRFLTQAAKPGMYVADVGANVGVYTLSLAAQVGAGGRVFAFEPGHYALECLARNCELNAALPITVVPAGLSDTVSSQLLFHVGGAPTTFSLGGALAGGDAENVELTTLDEWAAGHAIGRLDMIKIDVEGHEVNVLRGATAVLSRCRPLILFEVSSTALGRNGMSASDCGDVLNSLGYETYSLVDGALGPATLSTDGNFYAIHPDSDWMDVVTR